MAEVSKQNVGEQVVENQIIKESVATETDTAKRTTGELSQNELRTAGQRRINILWEVTQAIIALTVTSTGMFTASKIALRSSDNPDGKAAAITAFLLISNTVFLVIGFYFGRTNHQRTGGTGATVEGGR